jgi:hypothetical protein
MKLHHYALSAVLALGLLGGCGDFYGSLGLADEPYDYYTLGTYDGPDYAFYRDGHYYYDGHHRDDNWRRAHFHDRIHLDRGTHDRFAREWRDSRARTAEHIERHDDYHDGRDHH